MRLQQSDQTFEGLLRTFADIRGRQGVQEHAARAPEQRAASPLISQADLNAFVVHLRERGVKPVSCNTWIRALNAFCRRLHEQGELPTLVTLQPQRLEKRLLRTHDQTILRAMLEFKANDFARRRVYALVSAILDTGCRIEELLTARISDSISTTCC